MLRTRVLLASALLEENRLAEAKEQVEILLSHMQEVPNAVLDEDTPRLRLVCFKVLKAVSDERAQEQLAAAYQSLAGLSMRIRSESDQRSFRDNVPWNRDILERWDRGP